MSQDDQLPKDAPNPDDWDAYWRGTAEAASHDIGGVRRAEIARFWTELLEGLKPAHERLKMLDVAAGSGAVTEIALATLGADSTDITCVDYSPAAIASLEARYPNVTCCLADAGNIPLPPSSFDLVASQFGVEYAGRQAILSVSGLVSANGCLALLLHHREGGIHHECRASVDAVQRMRRAEFIPLSIDLLKAGFARADGASPEVYEFTRRSAMPAVLEMKNILRDHGASVAGGTIKRLYDDVSKINRRVSNYDKDEVIGWLEAMDREVVAYEGRMASMCDAAIGSADLATITEALDADGFVIERADPLQPNADWLPLAWVLIAKRQA